MKVWKLAAAKNLTVLDEPAPASTEGKIRVRVTKVLLTAADAGVYTGAAKVRYPIVPGSFAVGIVADETGAALFPKGARVLLHTFLPAPDGGTAKKDFSEPDMHIAGRTTDGYLKDFVYLSPSQMTPLPEAVSDEKALLIHHLALAKKTVDKLGAQKGDHVAVVGADILGVLVCQLLIYQQTAPILIDASAERLEFARRCGVYYTLPADEKLLDGVADMTGGNLAQGTVYLTSGAEANDTSIPFRITAHGRRVVVSGMYAENLSFNVGLALRKELSLHSVLGGKDYIEAAINLLIGGAVDLSDYGIVGVRAARIPAVFKTLSEDPLGKQDEINYVNLV